MNLKIVLAAVGLLSSVRHDIGIARDVYGEAFKEKVSGAANGIDVVTQVKFQHSPNVMVVGLDGFRCEKIADAVKGQPSREQQPRSVEYSASQMA